MEESRKKLGLEMLPSIHKKLKQAALEQDRPLWDVTHEAFVQWLEGRSRATTLSGEGEPLLISIDKPGDLGKSTNQLLAEVGQGLRQLTGRIEEMSQRLSERESWDESLRQLTEELGSTLRLLADAQSDKAKPAKPAVKRRPHGTGGRAANDC